jgi:Ca2+-binding EF-hand superfamily protein
MGQYERLGDGRLGTGAGYQSWKCVFTKIDADNSGVLDAAEMSKALREVPIP